MTAHGRHDSEPDPRHLGAALVVEHGQPVGGGAGAGHAARLERLVAGRRARRAGAVLRHGRHPQGDAGPAGPAGGPDPQRLLRPGGAAGRLHVRDGRPRARHVGRGARQPGVRVRARQLREPAVEAALPDHRREVPPDVRAGAVAHPPGPGRDRAVVGGRGGPHAVARPGRRPGPAPGRHRPLHPEPLAAGDGDRLRHPGRLRPALAADHQGRRRPGRPDERPRLPRGDGDHRRPVGGVAGPALPRGVRGPPRLPRPVRGGAVGRVVAGGPDAAQEDGRGLPVDGRRRQPGGGRGGPVGGPAGGRDAAPGGAAEGRPGPGPARPEAGRALPAAAGRREGRLPPEPRRGPGRRPAHRRPPGRRRRDRRRSGRASPSTRSSRTAPPARGRAGVPARPGP